MKKYLLLFSLLVSLVAYSQTTLEKGDVMVLGVNANTNVACGYPSVNVGGTNFSVHDVISIVALKDIPNGLYLDITDNGWQRNNNNRFANNEGTLRFTRSGGLIPAGTIFQLSFVRYSNNLANYQSALSNININPGWTVTSISNSTSTTGINIATSHDQILIMTDGTWNNGDGGSHNSQYTGADAKILYAFNTKKAWDNFATSANDSALPGDEVDDPVNFDIKNYHYSSIITNSVSNGTSIQFQFYNGLWTAVSKNEWIMRFLNPNYWGSVNQCSEYVSNLNNSPVNIIEANSNIEVCKDDSITISVDNNSIVTFQWYQTASLTNVGGTPIPGATNYNFTPSTNVAGTFYYYCQMTYTLNWTRNGANKSSSKMLPSLPFQVTVNPSPATSPVIPL